jgi:hypothetical protein
MLALSRQLAENRITFGLVCLLASQLHSTTRPKKLILFRLRSSGELEDACVTIDQQERVNILCMRIQEEHDQRKFIELVTELNQLLERNEAALVRCRLHAS